MFSSPTLIMDMDATSCVALPVTEQYCNFTCASRSRPRAARRGPLVGGRCPRPGSSGPPVDCRPPCYHTAMTTEMWIIAAVRVLGSLPVLRWPFWGAIFVLLVDLSDLFVMNLLHLGGVKGYQSFDKWLDQPYMLFFLIVSLRWEPALRNMAIGLYVFRAAGFIAFEVAGERDILIFFPNLFEVWFLLIAGMKEFSLDFRRDRLLVSTAAVLLLGAKMFQEYALHVGRWLDGFTAVEAVEAIWRFFAGPLF